MSLFRSFTFRPLGEGDFPFLYRWLRNPHVRAGWREILDMSGIRRKYLPRIAGTEPTHVYIIEYLHQPIGWIQWYRWCNYPEHAQQLAAAPHSAGIDLAIGEREMTGKGLGPLIITQFLAQFVFTDPTITTVLADPETSNHRSLRAFTKAGFTITKIMKLPEENFDRSVVSLSRPS